MSLTRLIIFRHGKAERHAPSHQDFDRGLMERGQEEADQTAARLASTGAIPDRVLVSAAQRTVETWNAAKAHFPDAKVEFDRGLYNADAATVLEAAEACGAASVMVIGHNPGMHDLALMLAARGEIHPRLMTILQDGFPTSAAAVFEWENGRPVAKALKLPRDVR